MPSTKDKPIPEGHVDAVGDERDTNNFGRHTYRKLSKAEANSVSQIKDAVEDLTDLMVEVKCDDHRKVAIQKAIEAGMWAVRGITN